MPSRRFLIVGLIGAIVLNLALIVYSSLTAAANIAGAAVAGGGMWLVVNPRGLADLMALELERQREAVGRGSRCGR
jgi:hypothetical protein